MIRKGESSYQAKLSENNVLAIRRLFRINPKFNKRQIAKKLNVRDATIHKIIKNEIWKDVEEFENNYQISNFGRLRSVARKINSSVQPCGFRINNPRIIVPQDNGNGYQQYYVMFNNVRVVKYAHRLVAKYFISNPDEKTEVNHIDGNKANNHVSNLEWSTLQ